MLYVVYSPLDQFDLLPGLPTGSLLYEFNHFLLGAIFLPVADFYQLLCFLLAGSLSDSTMTSFLPLYFIRATLSAAAPNILFSCWKFSFFIGLLIFISFFFFMFYTSTRATSYLVPSLWSSVFIAPFLLVESLVRDNLGFVHMRYMGHIWLIFSFIFLLNIFGMVPFFFTLTSHFAVTLTFSGVLFFGFNLLAIRHFGLRFFNLFIPSGAPAAIRPLLVYIEIISYFARVLSLSIRLFANMTAGHTLLKILAGYTYLLLLSFGGWFFVGVGALCLTFFITILEFFIAALQAYVFVMLVCVYLNDVLAVDAH